MKTQPAKSSAARLLILDADGVFMNELPYWRTALAAAFDHAGLRVAAQSSWDALSDEAFTRQKLQRVTKARGCNSNWDLTAVLARALEDSNTRGAVARAIEQQRFTDAAAALRAAADAMWKGAPPSGHLVGGFGIDKDGEFFKTVVMRFRDIFAEHRDVGWVFPKQQLAADPAAIRRALSDFAAAGWTLAVCTSRLREEIVPAMISLEIAEFFAAARIITQSDVLAGQERTGKRPLGKPHWFPLAVTVLGPEAAVAAARNGAMLATPSGEYTYVGDAAADIGSVRAAREKGLLLNYLHVDSGVSDAALLADIRADAATLAVVPDLPAAANFLRGGRP